MCVCLVWGVVAVGGENLGTTTCKTDWYVTHKIDKSTKQKHDTITNSAIRLL